MSEANESTRVSADLSKYLAGIGARGGKAAKGDAKRRGDSEYYKAIRAKSKRNPVKKDATQAARVDDVV